MLKFNIYLFILKFNYFIIFHYYRSIYTLLCFKYFTYFHCGQKKITIPSAAETRHAAEPGPYSAAKPRYPCCSTGISTSFRVEKKRWTKPIYIESNRSKPRSTGFPTIFNCLCTTSTINLSESH